MSPQEYKQAIREELMNFPWDNFGLDLVSDPATSDEWADELSYRISERINE